jgi:small subunit ribosomal protein S13e
VVGALTLERLPAAWRSRSVVGKRSEASTRDHASPRKKKKLCLDQATVGEEFTLFLTLSRVTGKGISGSAQPYKRAPPSWVKTGSKAVTEQVVRLARKGNTPSAIGAILRDGSGIPSVRAVTAKKITRILKSKGLQATLPEDLYFLIKKAVQMRKHLERNHKDKDQKFRLVLVESRIYRLARFYKKISKLPPTWKYEAATASALLA